MTGQRCGIGDHDTLLISFSVIDSLLAPLRLGAFALNPRTYHAQSSATARSCWHLFGSGSAGLCFRKNFHPKIAFRFG